MDASESHIRPPRATGPGGWMERLRPRRSRGTTESSTERKTVVPVGIVTDSAAALPDAWMAAHQRFVRMVPMPVMVNDQIFSEGSDDVPTELALGLAMGQPVRTSAPHRVRCCAPTGNWPKPGSARLFPSISPRSSPER